MSALATVRAAERVRAVVEGDGAGLHMTYDFSSFPDDADLVEMAIDELEKRPYTLFVMREEQYQRLRTRFGLTAPTLWGIEIQTS